MITASRILWEGALCGALALLLVPRGGAAPRMPTPNIDLSRDKVLYAVGYAHLDTQWNWTYQDTINTYLKNTLQQNFYLLDKYPAYTFNFTGSARYQLMKEYYPKEYERMKGYIAQNRWFISGSSVDEEDVNAPSAESILRQVLYGNQYFRREFGKESADVLLPDCFGFPASMPSIWAHAGLVGFSTQKLTWGSAVGIPFTVGVWEGPDGKGLVAALDPTSYTSGINAPLDTDNYWIDRVNHNGDHYGVSADYRYYGVGDVGGAPHENDVINLTKSLAKEGPLTVIPASSDQMYLDLTQAQKERLPRYKGDLLLTQHSAGSLTSKAYMKRWNRKNELLADAAERAAVSAMWLGAASYPAEKLERSWGRLLGSQMHDMLPGTAIPKAYEFAYNDEIIALNGFAATLTHAVGGVARALDTDTPGMPLIIYNPLSQPRKDVTEAVVTLSGEVKAVQVKDDAGNEVPSQIIGKEGKQIRFIFLADVPAVGFAVYSVSAAAAGYSGDTHLQISTNGLESERYKVTLDTAGDVASIIDKSEGRELLTAPARLAFQFESPAEYPSWNMDWADRKKPPYAHVDGPVTVRIVEQGPVRVALEVTRSAQGSRFVQRIRLNPASSYVEFDSSIDWLSRKSSLKASFPLAVANPLATYNMGLGTIARGNNTPEKYEVPSHQWFDLAAQDGSYGVSILDDGKFGSDKPADNIVRLTLLYTPDTARGGFNYQATQDWGHHDFTYALYGHSGDHRSGRSAWHADRLNQPLRAFAADRHEGTLGSRFSLASTSSPQVAITAIKKAQESDALIVRLQELDGTTASGIALRFAAPIVDAYEVDGQERRLNLPPPSFHGNELVMDMGTFAMRSFAVKLAPPQSAGAPKASYEQIPLNYDADVISSDNNKNDGGFLGTGKGGSLPAEQLPAMLESEGISFVLGPKDDGAHNALIAAGQKIELPQGDYNRLYLIAAADEDTTGTFTVGAREVALGVQAWSGFVGSFDQNVWTKNWDVTKIRPGFIKRDNIAWFATHRHINGKNEAYAFSYLFKYALPLTASEHSLQLPHNDKIKILALVAAHDPNAEVTEANDLYDNFNGRTVLQPQEAETVQYDFGTAIGKVSAQRAESFAELSLAQPRQDDYADQHSGHGVTVSYLGAAPHSSSGAVGNELPRLIDGHLSRHDDDTERSVWFDNTEGRFVMALKGSVSIQTINTYSWHKSNRAPQKFLLIGTNKAHPDLNHPTKDQWQLLADVDTNYLELGGVHLSSVNGSSGALGRFTYLMWISPNVGEGAFYTELDVIAAP